VVDVKNFVEVVQFCKILCLLEMLSVKFWLKMKFVARDVCNFI